MHDTTLLHGVDDCFERVFQLSRIWRREWKVTQLVKLHV